LLDKIEEYRQRAEAWRMRASTISDQEHGAAFIGLAEAWGALTTWRVTLLNLQRQVESLVADQADT
jgi:hypothetical protein